MTESTIDAILDIPASTLNGLEPANVREMLGWADGHRDEFRGLLNDFDTVIDDFNSTDASGLDQIFLNFHLVKGILSGQKLPTVFELTTERGSKPVRDYIKTSRYIRDAMLEGQKPAGEQKGPAFGYHKNAGGTDIRNLVIAGIFTTYEELIKARPEFAGKNFEQDRITEALMEIASQHAKLDLFGALARKDGMNWVDGYDRFDPRFRQSVGLS